jgi:hypothetical protein
MRILAIAITLLATGILRGQPETKPYIDTRTLETPNYTITITQRCEEYVIGCDHVTYHGVSHKSGNAIDLKGEQEMAMCRDGFTPCHLIGWRFKKGTTEYFVSDNGWLVVKQGSKQLVTEMGKWKE